MQLTSEQQAAVDAIRASTDRLLKLDGPAGTGKTMCVAALADRRDDVEVVVPTNKAAKVLRDRGIAAQTIHSRFFRPEPQVRLDGEWLQVEVARARLLRATPFQPGETSEAHKARCAAEFRRLRRRVRFQLASSDSDNAPLPPPPRVLVVDESSMLEQQMLDMLTREFPSMQIVLVGDPYQLPPVKDERCPRGYFTELPTTATLTRVLRTAGDSPILRYASELRRTGDRFSISTAPFRPTAPFTTYARGDWQFLCLKNDTRRKVNQCVRQERGFPGLWPVVGERLVIEEHVDADLVNGSLAEVVRVLPAEDDEATHLKLLVLDEVGIQKEILISRVEFWDRNFRQHKGDRPPESVRAAQAIANERDVPPGIACSFAYCLTAHKAQGSEFERVAVLNEARVLAFMQKRESNNEALAEELAARWLYTAVTRAKSELVITTPGWVY